MWHRMTARGQKARWYHLLIIVLLGAGMGAFLGWLLAGFVVEPSMVALMDSRQRMRTEFIRTLLRACGVHSARGGAVLGIILGAISTVGVLIRYRINGDTDN